MPWYFRFGIGPFRYSERISRTQAEKRAAAEARAMAKVRDEYDRQLLADTDRMIDRMREELRNRKRASKKR